MRRRWPWAVVGTIWLVLGGTWVLFTFAMWISNPSDDVDYAPMRTVFAVSLLTWIIVGTALLVATARRLRQPSSEDRPAAR